MRPPVVLLLLAALACRATPPAPRPAPFAVASTLSALDDGEDDGRPWVVRLECSAVERPEPGGVPLASAARLVFRRGAAAPLGANAPLHVGARWLDAAVVAPDARRAVWLPASTRTFTVTPVADLEDAPRAAWERLEIELERRPTGGELTLVLHGPDPEPPERLGLASDLAPGSPAARWFLPAPTGAAPQGGVLLALVVEGFPDAPDADDLTLLREAEGERRVALERARSASRPLTTAERARVERGGALEALADPARRRAALFFLADASGARLAADVALVGDEALLEACAAPLEAPADGLDAPAFGWSLEAAAGRVVLALEEPDDALQAALFARAGELARFPDLLGECFETCADLRAFDERLLQENRFFLEDADPAARVRAYDWLIERDAAPEGYDPLAALAARRAALAREAP